MKTLKQKMQVISAERRKKDRSAALIVEEMNLQELRQIRITTESRSGGSCVPFPS